MFALISDFIVFLQPLWLLSLLKYGDLAHLVERQVRNLKVAGSSPVISTKPVVCAESSG